MHLTISIANSKVNQLAWSLLADTGGSQAHIALRLVMQGLKMPVLSVAPMSTLSPSASQSEALNTLVAYEPLLPALEAEFKRYLN